MIQKRVIASSVIVSSPVRGLLLEQRDDAAAAADDVAVADDREAGGELVARGRVGVALGEDLLGAELGRAVEVDRVDGLVGATARSSSATLFSIAAVTTFSAPMMLVCTASNGLYSAGRHLLQRRGVDDDVDAAHRPLETLEVADVAEQEAQRARRRRSGAASPAA